MGAPIRVLVVDDSAFMRGAVARLVASDDRFTVAGQAADGHDAVRLAEELAPDVITMDFYMPGMNGAQAIRAILSKRSVPIVMLSAHTRDGAAETVEALAAGAVDFVAKPDGEVSANLSGIREQLVTKLLTAAGARVFGPSRRSSESPQSSASPSTRPTSDAPLSRRSSDTPPASRRGGSLRSAVRNMPPGNRLVVMASSTGGPAALLRIVPELRLGRDTALLIVQHMPAGFTEALAHQLDERASFPVREAKEGDVVEPGTALVAPGDSHLIVERGGRLVLDHGPPVHGVRPAADVTLKAAARSYGARCVGVVLTGMGKDGAMGLAAVKAAGGRTIAQDRESCTVYGMPRAAVELGVVEDIVTLDRVGAFVSKVIG